MTFRTPRLVLRPVEACDASDVAALDLDPEVTRYVGGPGGTLAGAVAWIESLQSDPDEIGFWTAETEGEYLGWFHLRPDPESPHEMELGFRLRREAWGRGFGTEGSLALLEHAWGRLLVPSVMATTDVANLRTQKLLERLGMLRVEEFLYEGEWPSFRYRILRPTIGHEPSE